MFQPPRPLLYNTAPLTSQQLKELLKEYVQHYRELLCTPDTMKQLLRPHSYSGAKADEVVDAVVDIVNMWGYYFYQPTGKTAANQEKKRFAQQLLHDIRAMVDEIPDLAKVMPEIEETVWQKLDLEVNQQSAESLVAEAGDIDRKELFDRLATHYVQLNEYYDSEGGATAEQKEQLDDIVQHMRTIIDENIAAKRKMFANRYWSVAAETLYKALFLTSRLYHISGADEDFERVLNLASLYRTAMYSTLGGSVPALPSLDDADIVPLSQAELKRDRKASTYIYDVEFVVLSLVEDCLREGQPDKARQIERYLINPYMRAVADTYYVLNHEDPTGKRQKRAAAYVIEREDIAYVKHGDEDIDDEIVINELDDGRVAFDEEIRRRYIAYVRQSAATGKNNHVILALGALQQCCEYTNRDRTAICQAVWEKLQSTLRPTEWRHPVIISAEQSECLYLLWRYDDADKVDNWLRQLYMNDPSYNIVKFCLLRFAFDPKVFATLEDIIMKDTTGHLQPKLGRILKDLRFYLCRAIEDAFQCEKQIKG
ncbi:MAG: hypothetical protein D8B38_04005 [Candidatus Saccharimonas sp.]|nr:MAG: hypothetical protein D8B38_04005 [Candidatus Saccharimonas sp.]